MNINFIFAFLSQNMESIQFKLPISSPISNMESKTFPALPPPPTNAIPMKIFLLGGSKTGKTAWLQRHYTGDFTGLYIPTTHTTVTELSYPIEGQNFLFQVYDGGTSYEGTQGAIAFYTRDCIGKTDNLVRDFEQKCPGIKIINVWSFCDDKEHQKFHRNALKYPEISCRGDRRTWVISSKSNHNFDKPFQSLLFTLPSN